MLNARLYRTAWLVAGVALVVALLTLQSPPTAPEPSLPVPFDGQAALEVSDALAAVSPEGRAPGSSGGDRAADWVARELAQVPGGPEVQQQEFSGRRDGRMVEMRNVYTVVPGAGDGRERGAILVVAPRDTPPGLPVAATGTGILVGLARQWATTAHERPLLFVSTDGSSIGNAGVRWFRHRFSQFDITAAVVLDDPGSAAGSGMHVWSSGREASGALALAAIATSAIERAGGSADPYPRLLTQVSRLAVPQTFGDQGPLVAAGVPAVTLAARPDSPPVVGPEATAERMALAGEAASNLIASLDASSSVPGTAAQVELGGRLLSPVTLRIVILLLALPILVGGIDAMARLRRAHVPLRPGLRTIGRHSVPVLALFGVGYLLVLVGLLPGSAAGAPPLPGDVPFGAVSGLGVALVLLAVAALVLVDRRRARLRPPGNPAAEAAAAAVAMAGVAVVAWVAAPFQLLIALPLMHASLVATTATRRWQVAALGAVAALPFLVLVVAAGQWLDRNPAYATWYLLETTAQGTRGIVGVLLAAVLAACAWSLAGLVVLRARKGLVISGSRDPDSRRAAFEARTRRRARRRR